MPKFLEKKLKQEYGDNPRAVFGTMNKIGAMKGNKTTDKGRAMEAKHKRDMKSGKKRTKKSSRRMPEPMSDAKFGVR